MTKNLEIVHEFKLFKNQPLVFKNERKYSHKDANDFFKTSQSLRNAVDPFEILDIMIEYFQYLEIDTSMYQSLQINIENKCPSFQL